jgi:hypothetical protein
VRVGTIERAFVFFDNINLQIDPNGNDRFYWCRNRSWGTGMKTQPTMPWHTWEQYKEADSMTGEDDLPTVYRLNRMIALGFEIDYRHGQQLVNDILLTHPNEKLTQREFSLDSTGWLIEAYSPPLVGGGRKQLRFGPDDGKEFEEFCRTVPTPSKLLLLTPKVPWIGLIIIYGITFVALLIVLAVTDFISQFF